MQNTLDGPQKIIKWNTIVSLLFFVNTFKDGFLIVWPLIHGLAQCQLSGRKAQVSKW
jgi:hypothetical protein